MTAREFDALAWQKSTLWPWILRQSREGWTIPAIAESCGEDEAYIGWVLSNAWRWQLPLLVLPSFGDRVSRPSRGSRYV